MQLKHLHNLLFSSVTLCFPLCEEPSVYALKIVSKMKHVQKRNDD